MVRAHARLLALALLALSAAAAVVQSEHLVPPSFAHRLMRRLLPDAGGGPSIGRDSTAPAHVTLEVGRSLRPISPLIYGVSVAGTQELAATGASLNRWGGNPNSRYNWVAGNAWNAARDWEFRNYGNAAAGASGQPSSVADEFVTGNLAVGAESLITVPALGWVARNGDTASASVGVPASGGPPVDASSGAIAGYDPAVNRSATSVRSLARKPGPFLDPPSSRLDVVYQDEWVNHLVHRFGPAANGGVQFYAIDNEPDLWSVTHSDVHPAQPDYEDMLATFVDYADAIKDVDPDAQVLGPTLSGWTGMFYSARDRGNDNFRTHADRRAHGDVPFLPWWLDQVRQHDQQNARRTLDYVDVHYYPQAAGVYSGASDEATERLRLRSTRSLWDGSYVDESWIGEPVALIPRLRDWVDRYYPGTRLAIGEWNWGADQTMNGALAIANVLGILGREGVDLAAYWTSPKAGSPGAHAFAMYTNYDNQGHHFGDEALSASSDAPQDVAVYASRDTATDDVLVIAINQRPDADLPVTVRLEGAASVPEARVFRYGPQDPARILELAPVAAVSGELSTVLPASSITLMRIGQAAATD